jgi:glycoside/pentoside/hexuronide:cation symporter, GPH family
MSQSAAVPSNPSSPSGKLPFSTKFFYGLGDWGNSTTSTIFGFFFAFFLNNVALLEPGYAAPVLLIGGIWDAVNDPLIGVFADRVRTRWGRRRPLFLFGALPFMITFVMLWWVPPWDSQILKALYYAFWYILWDTAFTFVAVPYNALTPELTEDYDERTQLNGFRMAVSMAGGLIAAIAVPLVTSPGLFSDIKLAYLLVGLAFGALAGVPYFILFFKVRERFSTTAVSTLNLFSGFRYTWRNHAFRYAAGIYLTAWVTIALVSSLLQYYITYWLNSPEQFDILLGLVQTCALICIPVMVWMSGRMGKTRAFMTGTITLVLVMLGLAALPQNGMFFAFILAPCAGLGIAAAHVIPWSIIPDIIEVDELENGRRQEGTFYGFLVFLQKTGSAVTLAFVQWVFANTGFVPNGVQNADTLTAIRVLIGGFPAILLMISIFLAWRFPINRKRHGELREALAARRSERENLF